MGKLLIQHRVDGFINFISFFWSEIEGTREKREKFKKGNKSSQ